MNLIDSCMSSFTDAYEILSDVTETGIDFFFVSKGERNILKIVSYSYVRNFRGSPLYNLALVELDTDTRSICDDRTTNNGDTYKVFHTVLGTIPLFFSMYEKAILQVRGSDSTLKFQDNCHLTCKKRCTPSECRNAHRRINIYRNYVDKNFDDLTEEYIFFGDYGNIEDQILMEGYTRGEKYMKIFVKKRKFE